MSSYAPRDQYANKSLAELHADLAKLRLELEEPDDIGADATIEQEITELERLIELRSMNYTTSD